MEGNIINVKNVYMEMPIQVYTLQTTAINIIIPFSAAD